MADLGWLGILEVIGALALFIYGMKVMSEGVQRLASLQLRDALQRVTQNKVSSFLTGFFTTAALQSSSATTVITVSFVNAGIISLTAAAGIIIGANVGSTVTIWMVTILGFGYDLFTLSLPMIALAMPFLFIKNGKNRHWAETVIGFSILLIALQFLRNVVPDIQKQQDLIYYISRLGNHGFLSIVLFLTIGFGFTALIQSSSASMALTLTLVLNGWLPFNIAAVMVLGGAIGTTVSTEIASWVGNTESKKAARLHVLFNFLGVIVFLPFLPLVLSFVSWMMVYFFKTGNPVVDKWAMPTGLAVFYTFFNIVCAILFLSIMPWFIRFASRTVKPKDRETGNLKFIGTGSNTADLSLPIALQEIIQQCLRIKNLNSILNRIINFTTEAEFQDQMNQANEYLNKLLLNQKATTLYLISMVEDKSSLVTSKQIKNLLNINLLIDHIRNTYDNIYVLISEKRKQRIWYGPTQRSILLHRINDATVMLKRSIQLLQTGSFNKNNWKGLDLNLKEKKQDYLDYEKELILELERGEMKMASVITYYRMAQYLDSINEALRNILTELSDEPLGIGNKQFTAPREEA
ncbi:MAG: Na/Pi cotransporter family protein [Saprospiraceae bacterium]|nr:Na/Pi cotransporter family protein [Candidatus Opimibacter skivensis]